MASTRSTTRARPRTGLRPSLRDVRSWAFPAVAAFIVYAGHLWFGANSTFGALVLVSAEALLLCALIAFGLMPPRQVVQRVLIGAAVLFSLLLLLLAASTTYAGLGAAHPLWSYVTGPSAAAMDRSAVLIEIAKLAGLAAIFMVGAILSSSERTSRSVKPCLLWGGGLFGLIALFLHLSRGGGVDPRLTANLSSANCAATVFAMLICLALSTLFGNRPQARKDEPEEMVQAYAPGAGLLLLFAACLVLTASRAGLAAAVACVVAFVAVQAAEGRLKLRAAAALLATIGIGFAGLLTLKGGLAVERFGAIVERSDPRAVIFDAAWRTFLQAPLGGFGLGSYAEVNRLTLAAPTYEQTWSGRDVHNVYLQWLLEAGAPGAALMFTCLGLVLLVVLLGRMRARRDRTWLAALLCADAAVLLHSGSDFALQVPSIAAMWSLLLGVQVGLVTAPSRRQA